VSEKIIDFLNANDYDSALKVYGVNQHTTEENIISLFINKIQRNVDNIQSEITFKESDQFVFDSLEEKTDTLNTLKKDKEHFMGQIQSIRDRIRESEECLICYQPMYKKSILDCCSNSFCFKCINIWLANSKQCPMCKQTVSKEKLFIVDENENENENRNEQETNVNGSESVESVEKMINKKTELLSELRNNVNDTQTKMMNLINIITYLPQDAKIILFSQVLDFEVKSSLIRHSIDFQEVKGPLHSVNNVVSQFKSGNVRVIVLNPIHFGSGLNFEMATDVIIFHKLDREVEMQVIGRAQRYGRTCPLRVWKLLYENEMTDL
jgi:hypothetical protein